MPIRKNLSMMTVLKRQNKPLQHVQIKTLQNLKMSVTRIYKYVCYEMNVLFKVFINHLPKIHRSILRKITIDLLYF